LAQYAIWVGHSWFNTIGHSLKNVGPSQKTNNKHERSCMGKIKFKRTKFPTILEGIKDLKETLNKPTNIQNEKLD